MDTHANLQNLGDESTLIIPPPGWSLETDRLAAEMDEAGNRALADGEPVAELHEAPPEEDTGVCPRCNAQLSEQLELGWCSRCGYCRYLAEGDQLQGRTERERRANLYRLPTKRWELFPEWLVVLVFGLLMCGVITFVAGHNLRYSPQKPQAIWCIGQASFGALLLVLAQVVAFFKVVQPGRRIRHSFLMLTPILWWGVWKRLPLTREAVWFAGCGVGFALGAATMYFVLQRADDFTWLL